MPTLPNRPAIKEPWLVPVTGTDAHLPAVPAARLTAEALRERFLRPPPFDPEIPGDGSLITDRPPAQAAVLVPLVRREGGLSVLLTQRTAHLREHAGQVSFPGGRAEPEDGSPERTALREAQEEIGLDEPFVEILGQMPVYRTVTAFEVTPVVALVRPDAVLRLDAFEVAEAFEVPLAFLMNPAHHQRHRVDWDGGHRQFLSMPWTGTGLATSNGEPPEPHREFFIWGATAAMLRNLYRFLLV
ncbi:8-oxo-dGTP pyrophosphatase MutT, NUDIX family [Roseateles sp. YR242]|uniref:NUDIX hydrolase n=1 Tax=Roseateles sp. YR242 TaxID=1855305 RepID=UPI0008C994F5|nr:CoA pyrophosphatase [Roseateles sp. YR242]SEK37130.1 8-oxo-dGTP pyrophosphatase MutT, NUDIX family [Roseateles sp. YR242]